MFLETESTEADYRPTKTDHTVRRREKRGATVLSSYEKRLSKLSPSRRGQGKKRK